MILGYLISSGWLDRDREKELKGLCLVSVGKPQIALRWGKKPNCKEALLLYLKGASQKASWFLNMEVQEWEKKGNKCAVAKIGFKKDEFVLRITVEEMDYQGFCNFQNEMSHSVLFLEPPV